MPIHHRYIVLDVLLEYDLTRKFLDSQGFAYYEILKGMYSL